MKSLFAVIILVSIVSTNSAFAQSYDWTPPTAPPGSVSIAPPVNTGSTAQIKRAGVGIDLSGTLLDLPPGAAFFVKAASLFVEITGAGALLGWVPSPNTYSIDTNGIMKAHGLYSASDIIVLPMKGGVGEAAVCADPATGILKICT